MRNGDALRKEIPSQNAAIDQTAVLWKQNEELIIRVFSVEGCDIEIDGGARWCIYVPDTGSATSIGTRVVGRLDVARSSSLVRATIFQKWKE